MEIKKAPDRLEVLSRIKQNEMNGEFNKDVENDPPFEPLNLKKADLLKKKPLNKVKATIATFLGWKYYEKTLKKKMWIFDGCTGLENLASYNGGAIVTCNHFSQFDNYAIYRALRIHYKKYRLHRVVREGNYSFKGLLGILLRNADTIPVGDGYELMRASMNTIKVLLKKNKKILIYPEQCMWWNYRKPRPMKKGAFLFAAKNNVPVIPCFITLKDSSEIGADGFPVQIYKVHILPLIYPDATLSVSENCEKMLNENFRLWKQQYELSYGMPLVYNEESGKD